MPAPRSQWKGFLKLSLVSCPIALYPAITDANKIRFRQVNRRTGNRLRHQLVDAMTGEIVQSHDKGRGYEIEAQQFLPVEEQEIEAARAAAAAPPPAPEREIVGSSLPSARKIEEEDEDKPEAVEEEAAPAPAVRLENDHTIEIERFVPRRRSIPPFSRRPTSSCRANLSDRKRLPSYGMP
jgi:DNA end-binding protein Ku